MMKMLLNVLISWTTCFGFNFQI